MEAAQKFESAHPYPFIPSLFVHSSGSSGGENRMSRQFEAIPVPLLGALLENCVHPRTLRYFNHLPLKHVEFLGHIVGRSMLWGLGLTEYVLDDGSGVVCVVAWRSQQLSSESAAGPSPAGPVPPSAQGNAPPLSVAAVAVHDAGPLQLGALVRISGILVRTKRDTWRLTAHRIRVEEDPDALPRFWQRVFQLMVFFVDPRLIEFLDWEAPPVASESVRSGVDAKDSGIGESASQASSTFPAPSIEDL